jgi:predicted transcriptional regulator
MLPSERLFETARNEIVQLASVVTKDAEVARALNVSKAQAKTWLLRLVNEGVIEKRKKPSGYIVKQRLLFD